MEQLNPMTQECFKNVLKALQPMEEMGAPTEDYAPLMQAIIQECSQRTTNFLAHALDVMH
jgi:hypothetical protein